MVAKSPEAGSRRTCISTTDWRGRGAQYVHPHIGCARSLRLLDGPGRGSGCGGGRGPLPGADPGCQTGPMLSIGVVALGVGDVGRAAAFWCEALGYEIRTDGFGGWAAVLTPPAGGAGTKIALQRNETPPQDHPRLHLDLHVSSAAEQTAEAARLMAIGAERVGWDSYPDDPDFIVLADPDGNRFCIVDLSHAPD